MTVINAMIFNSGEGAMVADEQSSNTYRKFEVANKISKINSLRVKAAIGGSGMSTFLNEVADISQHQAEMNREISRPEDMANLISCVMFDVKKRHINGIMLANFRLTETEYLSGKLKTGESIDRGIMESINKYITCENFSKIFELPNFILLAYDSNRKVIELYHINARNACSEPVSGRLISIGSGADMADDELSSFFEQMPREKRDNINPMEGIAELLYATEKASKRNIGVGGTPQIYTIIKGQIYEPCENNSRLAMEIVKATRAGFLPENFQNNALESLIVKGNSAFPSIEAEMWKIAEDKKNKDSLNMFLRGYKVEYD